MVPTNLLKTVVTIHTGNVTNTGAGYLSKTYSSQYSDPASGEAKGGASSFEDQFSPLGEGGPWVLSSRRVSTEAAAGSEASEQTFLFEDLQPLG